MEAIKEEFITVGSRGSVILKIPEESHWEFLELIHGGRLEEFILYGAGIELVMKKMCRLALDINRKVLITRRCYHD